MKYIVKNHEELEKKIAELVKDGYKQTDITEHELVFTKGLHARDTIYPTFWDANRIKYNKNDVFENLKQFSKYATTVYTGKIKPEYINLFTKKDVADICDNYNYNFGNYTKINNDGTFTCEIYID